MRTYAPMISSGNGTMKRSTAQDLSSEHLMEAVRELSAIIGPRQPTSENERAAADYVHERARQLTRREEVINQPFRSINGFRQRLAPLALLTGLSLLYGLRKDNRAHWVSGIISVGLSVVARDIFLQRAAIWESWMATGESQNVIVRIPPRRRARRRVVFVAHLDSGVHRVTTDPRVVGQLPRTVGGITLMALVGGVLTALAGRRQRWRTLRGLIGAGALGSAALTVADEHGPTTSGANANASGVAALLGLADALQNRPLEYTEVVLAFTGAATAAGTGADVLATAYGDEWKDALWVVVNNVGAGELCWVTRHGISPYAYYYPDPAAVSIMERVAATRPDLGLMGKKILTLDELALLRDRDLHAVALMGYDRVTGLIPHWRRSSDTIHAIEPATLARAAETLRTTVEVVDTLDEWPLPR